MTHKPRTRRPQSREERRAEKREAREAQELANRRKIEKLRETTCCYCGDEVGADDFIKIGDHDKACLGCVGTYGKEVVEEYMARCKRPRLQLCPNCYERQETTNFGSFWTGRDYVAVCKTCIETCGETEIRDNTVYHRGTAPFMNGGLPTLGKKR